MTDTVIAAAGDVNTAAHKGPAALRATVTGDRGRYLLEAEGKVFVADSNSRPDGPVAPNPGELLLSALAVCALGSVQRHGAEQGLAIGAKTTAIVTSTRHDDESKRTQFKLVHIEVFVDGPSHEAAESLVGQFTASCPIFNTVRRGAPVTVEVATDGGRSTILDNTGDWRDDAAKVSA